MFVGGRRLWLVSVAVVVAVVLGGCSGSSDSPRQLPPLSTTPAASASTPPPQDPKAAAVAVVREYFRLVNQLPQAMEYRGLARLMTSSCACRQQIAAIRGAKAKGEHYVDHWHGLSLSPAPNGPNSVDVLARYDTGAGGLVDSDGQRVTYAAPQRGVQRLFHVVQESGKWKINGIAKA